MLSNPAYSGLVKRRYDRPHERDTTIVVQQDLLDNIVPDDIRIDFIKIDVEGGELGVLRGAKRTILRSRPWIVFEHGKGAADCYGTRPGQVHEFLVDECGLEVVLMERFLKGLGALDRIEFIRQFDEELNYFSADELLQRKRATRVPESIVVRMKSASNMMAKWYQ